MRAERKGGGILLFLMYLLFGAYVLFTLQIILFKTIPLTAILDMDTKLRSINLIPFRTIAGFMGGNMWSLRALVNILGNIFIFVPLGVFVSHQGSGKTFRRKAVILLSATLFLEIIQYVLALGSSDIDDILLNFAGGLLGIALYKGMKGLFRTRQRLLGAVVGFLLLSGMGGILAVGIVQPEVLPFLDTGVEYVTDNKPQLQGIDLYTKGDLSGSLAAVEEHSVTLSTETEAVMGSGNSSGEFPGYVTENHQISMDASTRIFFEYVRVEKQGLLKFKMISRYEEKNLGDLKTLIESRAKESGSMHSARVWFTDSPEQTAEVLLIILQEQ
ncbi:VanZ family protein [Paenibacillus sp. MMS20-IR301]|uniref:VanZ family protein n=1 Tax=Paenibacillus sp. MMS20-IR301 TaxID=2895946 RepID=UPI0028ED4717|nr:VanZ family protein [Paenibacillus sp. MMS20-IR301]WNS40833.1 VanZ family protein [Paenibacillus sp. MMS20-IR301]